MKRVVRAGKRSIEYTLICASNRTDLLLQALPERRVRVYAPKSARLRDIDKLVIDRISWLDDMHAQLDAARAPRALEDGQTLIIEGKPARVAFATGARDQITLSEGALSVITRTEHARARAELVKNWLCKRALERVRQRLSEYAPSVGKPYGRVTIREQRTRWGSCSSLKNLNFNWKLILAPEQALTYVVIHELCHLIDFNHSQKFWSEVRKRMPDYEIWKKWLKANGKTLTFP